MKSVTTTTIAKNISKVPITIKKDSSVLDAISMIQQKKISRLIVEDEGLPIGIISEKEYEKKKKQILKKK